MKKVRVADAIDSQIIQALSDNPNASNKALATAIAVSETTVANRLRAMSEDNVMRVIAQRNIFSDGHRHMGYALVEVQPSKLQATAREIAKFEETTGVSRLLGKAVLFVSFRTRNLQTMEQLTTQQIGMLPAVLCVNSEIFFQIKRMNTRLGILSSGGSMLSESAALDDTQDNAIFSLLQQNARISNQEVARQTGLSATVVRNRLNKLIEQNTIQMGAICHPQSLGYTETALLRLLVLPHKTDSILGSLSQREDIALLGTNTGSYNITAVVNEKSQQELESFCQHLLTVPGVTKLEASIVTDSVKHRFDLFFPADMNSATDTTTR